MPGAIALFTRESVPEILAAGGTGNWATNADRACEYPFVVLVRNGRHPSSPSDTAHRTAFLVGRVSGTRKTAEAAANGYPRIFIDISEYALIKVPDAWSKSQNPVWHTTLEELGIAEDELQFQPVPHAAIPPHDPIPPRDPAKTLADMKREIGRLFGVPVSAVEIIIRH